MQSGVGWEKKPTWGGDDLTAQQEFWNSIKAETVEHVEGEVLLH